MDSGTDHWTARAWLLWQVEMGADEAILDAPVNRFALPETLPRPGVVATPPPQAPGAGRIDPDPAVPAAEAAAKADDLARGLARGLAHDLAAGATDLAALAAALAGFDLCDLKKGARSFVFADGNPAARVMVVGEAPGREEDLAGRPFVGPAGQLLDRMFAAIDMGRNHADPARSLYITNTVPWRPPGNRPPEPGEMAMLRPFLERHIALADPEIIVLMGNSPCAALLGQTGITRMRGQWAQLLGRPVLPMFHPANLLRSPENKRLAWADLLALQDRLRAPRQDHPT